MKKKIIILFIIIATSMFFGYKLNQHKNTFLEDNVENN